MRLFIFTIIFIGSIFPALAQDEPVNLNIMEVMKDAPYRQINYRALINFKSPLIAQRVTAYLYDKNSVELKLLKTFRLNRLQKFEIDFQYFNKKDLYLVFLLDEVGFNFNDIRPAQMVCMTKIDNEYTAAIINCDFGTTISYMMAFDGKGSDVFNSNSINKWLTYLDSSIYENQTYQNYVGMFAVSMTYLTRYPKHISLEMVNTGFIKVYSEIVKDYILRISSRYYADIDSFEAALSRLSNGFSGFGYKVEKDRSLLFKTALSGLSLAEQHQIYLNDFFNGGKELRFINKTVYRLASVKFNKPSRTILWTKWPWMNHVVVEIDGTKEVIVHDDFFVVPGQFTQIKITPFGTRGKFVESIFSPQSLDGIAQ
jgi:hypothetical protein|tara:strand:+ start:36394 stop:37503 length:1110 start_codon:yes stop_codon:yes gene_type:complete